MIRFRSTVVAVMLIAMFCTSLFASNGTQIGTVGARGTAMGSAFRGLADDWSAVFFNPAGLTQLSGTTFGVSYALITPTGTYQPAAYPNTPFSGMTTGEASLKEQTFQVPAIGFFFKPVERITIGVGLVAPFGLGAQFDLISLPASYGNLTGLSGEYETMSDHEVAFFQPTLAVEITDKLSFGIGAGYSERGSLEINQVKLPIYSSVNAQVTPLLGLFESVGVLNPDHKRLVAETNLTGEGSAWTFNAGLHYKVFESLSVGVSGRFYTPLKLRGNVTNTVLLPGMNETVAAQYMGAIDLFVASDTTLSPEDAAALSGFLTQSAGQAFPGAVSDTRYYAEADMPLPTTIGLGLAYKPMPKLTLTADVSWTNWAAWDTIDVHLQYQETKSKTQMVENWENTIQIGLGAEFRAVDAEMLKLDLRAGGYIVPSPVPVETINPTILDPNNRTVITAGLGISYGRATLNLAYEMVMLPENDIPADDYIFDATGVNENWAGIYNMSANVITVGLTISR